MAGKIMGMVISLAILTFLITLIIFFFLHATVKEHINQLNYNVCETVATAAVLSEDLYDYLENSTRRYGSYTIRLRLDRQVGPGMFDTYYDNEDIIGKKLRVGDRITISLEDRAPTLFGRLLNAAFMGYSPDGIIDTTIRSVKTAVVSRNSRDLIKGYDVIADIKAQASDPRTAVFVSTLLNPAGCFYGRAEHPDISVANPYYDTEKDTDDRIFDNGDFTVEIIRYEDGGIRLIRYVQQ